MVAASAHLLSFSFSAPAAEVAARPRREVSHLSSSSSSFLLQLVGSRQIVLFPRSQDRSGSPSLRLNRPRAAVPARRAETFDPELRLVLELATDAELIELEQILFGPSFFSPLLKSITSRQDVGYFVDGEYIEEREDFIEHLESRFLYLAADARSTLRGWRPSYRNILLRVKRKLGVPCSNKLSTEDLEVEIFLHLLSEHSSDEVYPISFASVDKKLSSNHGSLEVGLSQRKVLARGVLKVGAKELQDIVMKGCGMLAVARIYQLLARKVSGKMLLEAANYELKHEMIKRGGRLAASSLEFKAAELFARQGLARAASRYLGLRSAMMLLGPLMWGTFLADVVIQMLGTDYARILRAIYAFAQVMLYGMHANTYCCSVISCYLFFEQIRLTRTYGWRSDKE
ncbi:hypothetical protein Cni_G15352 [Canna indica]|uniref:Uncharacterized protein n=1 Tax=Canna indica TaxID=4628 RepID=A0AAQ3KDD2_9LILI|nr:hypothetical protein Cni_G15352 [Canna indica]